MSRKSQVKASIDAKIKKNGKQEITGPILNGVLTSMLDASVMDVKDADGNVLPRDADGNVTLENIANKNFVVNEAQKAYDAAGILVATEKDRAEAAEELIKSIADSKLTRVDLACDGYEPLKITYRGQTEALTFAEIYGLVTDKSKFVTLLDSEMFILLPSLSVDGDAIEFAGINVMSHQAEAQRVIINQENQVSVYPIELEDSGRKVSSAEGISGADAFIKYPNIKALQDYVAAHGGGLTPEQEQKLNESINQATAEQVAHEAIDGELTGGGSISTAIIDHHDDTKQNTLTPGTNITIENNVISSQGISDAPSDGKQYARKNGAWAEVQGGGSDWEDLVDYTTTEAVSQVKFLQGDNGQVFDDYSELYLIMLTQPCTASTADIDIDMGFNGVAWGGRYGLSISVPGSNRTASGVAVAHFWKSPMGIMGESIRSVNFSTSSASLQRLANQGLRLRINRDNVIISPDELENPILFSDRFNNICIGHWGTKVFEPNCKFIILGKK